MRQCKLITLIRPNIDKLSMPRKINVGYHPEFMQKNWLTTVKAKEAEATKQAPTPAQPAKASATKSQKYCVICSPSGKLCPNEYPITADWSDDSEEGKETQEQNKVKDNLSDIEDWHGDLEE